MRERIKATFTWILINHNMKSVKCGQFKYVLHFQKTS